MPLDNVLTQSVTPATVPANTKIAVDTIPTTLEVVQYVKLMDGTENQQGVIPGGSGGLAVEVKTLPAGGITIQDGGNSITVDGTFWPAAPATDVGTVRIKDSAGGNINNGQQFMANSLPVVIASNQSAVPMRGTDVSGTPGSTPLTIQGIGAAGAVPISGSITTTAGPADNAAYTFGTTPVTPGGFVVDDTASAAPAENQVAAARISLTRQQIMVIEDGGGSRTQRVGVSNRNALAIEGVAGGTAVPVSGSFSLGIGTTGPAKAEDVAAVDADQGIPAMAIRKATPGNTSNADGDYEMLQMAAGRLWVDASGPTLTVGTHPVTNAGVFAVQVSTPLPVGTNSIGIVDTEITTPAALIDTLAPATAMGLVGSALIGFDHAANQYERLRVSPAGTAVANGTPGVLGIQGVLTGAPVIVSGVVGNPVDMGAQVAPTTQIDNNAVTQALLTQLIADPVGKLITLPYAAPAMMVSGVAGAVTPMSGTTSTLVLPIPTTALHRNYITQITVTNSHATVGTDILIQDGSAGTTLYVIPAAAVYGGATITFPVPLRQPTAATAIYAQNVVTGASTRVSISGYAGR